MMAAQATWGRGFKLLAAGLLGLALAACGGGGGDDGGDTIPPPGDVDLNAANQTSAARAAAVAVQGGLVITTTGLTGGASQSTASAVQLLRRVSLRAAKTRSTPREQAMGLLDVSSLFLCVSGTVTATLDDRDNSLSLTPGDVLSASFVNCQVEANSDELINGALTATYTNASAAPFTVGATVDLVDLRDSSLLAGRSVTLNGGFAFSYVEPNMTTSNTHVNVPNALSIVVVHPLYQDTVVLQPGYTMGLYGDLSTPPGAPSGGRTIIEVLGKIHSARTGGIFDVWSQPPGLDLWDVDLYPRSGWVRLQGRNGEVRLTVLSNTSVRLQTDAEGDGNFEASLDLPWDNLL